MALPITNNARFASQQTSIEPNIVMEIDGVATLYGAIAIQEFVRIGDEAEIGDPDVNALAFFIGGLVDIDNQSAIFSFEKSSQSIRQTLQVDKGVSSSVSSLDVALIDKGEEVTRLITPDETVSPTFDLLNRKVRIFYGFNGTAWPEDYITIFRGRINDITSTPGLVKFNLKHPDDKKRNKIFKEAETELTSSITDSGTVIVLDDVTDFLEPISGPSGTPDPAFKSAIIIDEEVIEYTGISGSTLTGVTRGAQGTLAVAHTSGDSIKSFYILEDTAMQIALKLMMSGFDGPFLEDNDELTAFNIVTPTDVRPNTLFFKDIDVNEEFGLVTGDYITTTGALNAANNVTLEVISGIEVSDEGSILTITGVSFVDEGDTAAVIDFRSQFDTFPSGMKMQGDEVDIVEHQLLEQRFLSSVDYRFYLKETIEAREFLEEQVYAPTSAFSLPRKSRASVGYHIGPIPGVDLQTIDNSNVKNADKVGIKRSTSRYFFNEIIYRFDDSAISDEFLAGQIELSATSKNQTGKDKGLIIDAKGIRSDLQGASFVSSQAKRRLDRYEFGAETLSVEVLFKTAFTIEVGDIVLFDGSTLKVTDITKGSRNFDQRFMEVQNRVFNLRTGKVSLDLIDTNFGTASRFALIGPSSKVKTGSSTTQFTIEESFSSRFGANEFFKWDKFVPGMVVKVRNADFSINDVSTISSISGNLITLSTALSGTPTAGMIMEASDFDDTFTQRTDYKLIFGHMTDLATFPDGSSQYNML